MIEKNIVKKTIEWRRHIHQYPELGQKEFQTAQYIEKQLKNFALELDTP